MAGLLAAIVTGVIQAQAPWPTPPPAPVLYQALIVPGSQIKPVPVPRVPGAVSAVVQPVFPGGLPRIPPLPTTVFVSGEADPKDRVKLHIEAGSTRRTLQLLYTPVDTEAAPEISLGGELLRVFEIEAFDHEAKKLSPILLRPWKMEVPVPDSTTDPSRLLIARYQEDKKQWKPLLTSYYPGRGLLTIRIVVPGLFAVVTDPAPFET